MSLGSSSTAIALPTRSGPSGSMRDTDAARMLVTQTKPLPVAIARGSVPIGTLPASSFVLGSIRATSSAPASATHTQRPPAATSLGSAPSPSGISKGCVPSSGSRRYSASASRLTVHTESKPTATATGFGTSTVKSNSPLP